MSGTLYGVGLGPGDPELMTLKAARLIETARVVAYPMLEGTPSFARQIAAGRIAPDAREIAMPVPMRLERGPAQAAYDAGAQAIAQVLDTGQDVTCLCEGDPFFYGSFMYLYARLAPRYRVEVVPGVTSLTAAATRAGRPLAARNEVVTVLPGPLPDAELEARIDMAETVAVLKLGRHAGRVRDLAARRGWLDQSVYIGHATLPKEHLCPLRQAPDRAPYFSLALICKVTDPWL
ncbi:precorrin-2 C(20)-methyltransferase [Frigidibacter sp. ROC022]|uniref:precorrin-2 C(20)-methyltransferase n=1 Tax=Frigidibacter sp. ROC022 TaxID=2971796 RepID=UPI00215A4E04|nr:precorrin-2 C(20)-methyltransferase [Frigidibacter sp. ROC022]MCR8724816.1 precorrin-2 C(20)-methyltransferase [Frigidibacter sp. ROC022]